MADLTAFSPEPEADLAFTAFRYVAGELTPAEAAAFEDRLADDQGAREAVATAVELAGAVRLVARHPARRARRPVVWIGAGLAGLAASLAAIVGPSWLPVVSPPAPRASVVLAWSALRDEAGPAVEDDDDEPPPPLRHRGRRPDGRPAVVDDRGRHAAGRRTRQRRALRHDRIPQFRPPRGRRDPRPGRRRDRLVPSPG